MKRSGSIALVGPPNAGKSTLLNAILGEKVTIVSRKAHTTRDRILGVKHSDEVEYIYVDSPGFCAENANGALSRYLRKSLRQATSGVDRCVLVLDGTRVNPKHITEAISLLERDGEAQPDLIVINKIDLLTADRLLPALKLLGEECAARGFKCELFPISAEKGSGLADFERHLGGVLPSAEWVFPEEVLTDRGIDSWPVR